MNYKLDNVKDRLGYLGPRGTFSEIAALRYCKKRRCELVEYSSLESILQDVDLGRLEKGIVPVENSTEGSVNVVFDLLAGKHQLAIKGELLLSITHSLLAKPGVSLGDVRKIFSHPQALAQCREFLRKELPLADWKECTSTAAAAVLVSKSELPWAAVAPAESHIYGLEVLKSEINDYPDNMTRFWVISKEQQACIEAVCKTSLVFSVHDSPGALYLVLQEFAMRDLNLTRIESRPAKRRLGEYIFFVDFLGTAEDPVVQDLLYKISKITTRHKLLGSYPLI